MRYAVTVLVFLTALLLFVQALADESEDCPLPFVSVNGSCQLIADDGTPKYLTCEDAERDGVKRTVNGIWNDKPFKSDWAGFPKNLFPVNGPQDRDSDGLVCEVDPGQLGYVAEGLNDGETSDQLAEESVDEQGEGENTEAEDETSEEAKADGLAADGGSGDSSGDGAGSGTIVVVDTSGDVTDRRVTNHERNVYNFDNDDKDHTLIIEVTESYAYPNYRLLSSEVRLDRNAKASCTILWKSGYNPSQVVFEGRELRYYNHWREDSIGVKLGQYEECYVSPNDTDVWELLRSIESRLDAVETRLDKLEERVDNIASVLKDTVDELTDIVGSLTDYLEE